MQDSACFLSIFKQKLVFFSKNANLYQNPDLNLVQCHDLGLKPQSKCHFGTYFFVKNIKNCSKYYLGREKGIYWMTDYPTKVSSSAFDPHALTRMHRNIWMI